MDSKWSSNYDLNADADGYTVKSFIMRVAEMARDDHRRGDGKRRSGEEITRLLCSNWRVGHYRLASTIYNKMRWSLELAQSDGD